MAETKTSSDDKGETKTTLHDAQRHADTAASSLDAKLSGPLAPLEESLDGIFGSKAQYQLPGNIKKLLVDIAPWLALLAGIGGLFSAYGIWWALRNLERVTDLTNQMYGAFGISSSYGSGYSFVFWIYIVSILVFSALALLAFPGLRAKKKVGWNLMFYSMLANIAYGVISLFYNGGGVGSLLNSVIMSAIGLYILFQIRSRYLVKS